MCVALTILLNRKMKSVKKNDWVYRDELATAVAKQRLDTLDFEDVLELTGNTYQTFHAGTLVLVCKAHKDLPATFVLKEASDKCFLLIREGKAYDLELAQGLLDEIREGRWKLLGQADELVYKEYEEADAEDMEED